MGDIMESFFGHIPEEPKLDSGGFGDFGVKLNPKKMPEALKDGTVTEDSDHARRRPCAL